MSCLHMLFEITKGILSFKGNFEYDVPDCLLSPLGTVLSPVHLLPLRIPALDTQEMNMPELGRVGKCQMSGMWGHSFTVS